MNKQSFVVTVSYVVEADDAEEAKKLVCKHLDNRSEDIPGVDDRVKLGGFITGWALSSPCEISDEEHERHTLLGGHAPGDVADGDVDRTVGHALGYTDAEMDRLKDHA